MACPEDAGKGETTATDDVLISVKPLALDTAAMQAAFGTFV